jgi:hypothetical protein
MRRFTALSLAFSVLALVAGQALAADKHQQPERVRGQVVAVDGPILIIQVKADHQSRIVTDEKTEVTIEGKAGKLADLKAGQQVVATISGGKASRIEVPTPRKKGDGHGGHH